MLGDEMEKRIHPRIEGTKYLVNVSDGQKFFSGYADNLSRSGLRLEDIPKKLDHTARRLSVVLSGEDQSFKMLTRPCWTQEERSSKIIGLEIINAPWGWAEFVMAREPAFETPWAETEI